MSFKAGRGVGGGARTAVAVFMLVLAAGCSPATDPAKERVKRARDGTGDLVIAAPWPWELRKDIRYGEGLQMAVDEVNLAGGIAGRNLRLVKYEDRESIDEGRVVAQQIAAAPDVVAVVGHLQSYITVDAASVYNQAGLVLLTPTATDPRLTQHGYKQVFRATFTDLSVGQKLAELAAAHQWRRTAICYIRSDYGRNVANAYEARATQLGLTVNARSSYDPSEQANERTFEQVLGEWKTMDFDAIVLAGEVPSAAIFVAEARRRGIDAPIVGGDAMSTPGLMAVAGRQAEGVIVASFFHPDEPRPEVARFVSAFREKYGIAPDAGSALGYDCVRILAAAMQKARSAVPHDVADALHALKDWPGVTGRFAFDEHGDLIARPIVLSVVHDGKFEYFPLPDGAAEASTTKVASATR
jgi:branched-chain amino acid transport system substrate-binding protein